MGRGSAGVAGQAGGQLGRVGRAAALEAMPDDDPVGADEDNRIGSIRAGRDISAASASFGAELREQLHGRCTLAGRAAVCARLRPDPSRPADSAQAARTALRSLGLRTGRLGAEAADLKRSLGRLVAVAAPATESRLGCGTHRTATLLVAAGHTIDRLGSEASFAHPCGTAPVPAYSGRTSRHRLNFAGKRDANRALHMIAIVRLRYCQRTRIYLDRRVAQGKTINEAIRCLKRYIAREIYRTLRADLATLRTRN